MTAPNRIASHLIQELRECTGGGLLECKKTLEQTNGDVAAAIEIMRKSGKAAADKKSKRTAAEGVVVVEKSKDEKACLMIEVNCETDFVARGVDFTRFAAGIAQIGLREEVYDVASLMATPVAEGEAITVADWREELVAKLGENINIRRIALITAIGDGAVESYVHGNRIGAVVNLTTGNKVLAHDIAMHVVACRPIAINVSDIPAHVLADEQEIYMAQSLESGKPQEIVAKVVKGRMQKFINNLTLLNQPFVKNPDVTIAGLLKLYGSDILGFVRFEVGEGIEKEKSDFAAEVMAQVGDKK